MKQAQMCKDQTTVMVSTAALLLLSSRQAIFKKDEIKLSLVSFRLNLLRSDMCSN